MVTDIIMIVLCIWTMAAAFCTVGLRRKGRSFDGMIFKFLSSFGFMSVAFVGYCHNPDCEPIYFCLVLFGLLFGLGGDVLLGIKEIAPAFKMKLIAMGTLSFLANHIFFLVAFLRISGFVLVPLLLTAVIGVIAVVLLKVFKLKVDAKMGALLTVYYMLLWYKAFIAAYLYFKTHDWAFLSAAIGSALFIASDTCLAFVYFYPVKKKNKLVTAELSTYYPAQLLLAASVALIAT